MTSGLIVKLRAHFSRLQGIVGIIARYAVMENLYQQSNSTNSAPNSLHLKQEYESSLIELCVTMLRFFVASFQLGRGLSGVGDVQEENLERECEALVQEVMRRDRECQGFRVVVEVREGSNSGMECGGEETEIDDVSDEGWEEIDTAEGVEGCADIDLYSV